MTARAAKQPPGGPENNIASTVPAGRARSAVTLLVGSALCVPGAWLPVAHAQEASGGATEASGLSAPTLEEIIVSARKRDESLQEVPIAISVISGELARDANLNQLDDFIELIPNATFTQDADTSAEISIRGTGRNISDEDPGVGLNRDGIYVGGLLFSTANLYDLDRVEILRGPQAGLYGRNAVGGAVNIVSKRPGFDFGGYLDVQAGSKSSTEFRAGVDLPIISDRWAIRVAGLSIDQSRGFDYIENQRKFADAVDNKSFRIRSLYTPHENLEFLTTYEFAYRDDGRPLTVLAPDAEFGFLDADATIPYPGTKPADTLHQQRNFPEFSNWRQWHAYQEVNWTLPQGTGTGIVSYREATYRSSRDEDATVLDISDIAFDAGNESLFAELRYASGDSGRFRFLTGVNYVDEDLQLNYTNNIGSNFAGALGGANIARAFELGYFDESWAALGIVGLPITIFGWTPFATGWGGYLGDTFPTDFLNEQRLRSTAVFLEADYRLTERVRLWGNARYTRDKKSIDFAQTWGLPEPRCPVACGQVFGTFLGIPDPELFASTDVTFTKFSPGGGVDFQVSDNALVYAKIVTGFKAGGFNSVAGRITSLPFAPETTLSYEAGAKTDWLDDRLRVNIAVFEQKRKDALVTINDPDMPINSLGVNAGEITNRGAELEISAQPIAGLRLIVAAGYLDSKFTDFVLPRPGGDLVFSGNRVPRNFKHSLSGIATYSRRLTDVLSLSLLGSYRNAWGGWVNNENSEKMARPETIDLRVALQGRAWKVAVYSDNVADRRYTVTEFDSRATTGRHFGTYSPGRTVGVQLAYSF